MRFVRPGNRHGGWQLYFQDPCGRRYQIKAKGPAYKVGQVIVRKLLLFLAVSLIVAAAGCRPATPQAATGFGGSTAIQGGTAIRATVSAGGVSPSPLPTLGLPTLTPTLSSGLSPTELKYRLLAQFPNLFFCDPDLYPVARADLTQVARERFPELQSNPEEFQAILAHNGLAGLTSFTDDQKLLIYQEHKKLASILFEASGDVYQFQLRISQGGTQGFVIKGAIDGHGSISVQDREPTLTTCPICLAAQTRISTPSGLIAIEALQEGDPVWTVDPAGDRVPGVVLSLIRRPVPSGSEILHVVLSDGRELWASPSHPTTDGRVLGDLSPGDRLDGAVVLQAEPASYNQPATYDLLPSGGTGFYWADGVLLGSTLAAH